MGKGMKRERERGGGGRESERRGDKKEVKRDKTN